MNGYRITRSKTIPFVMLVVSLLTLFSPLISISASTTVSLNIPNSGKIIYGLSRLHTEGRFIKNSDGEIIILRGASRGETTYAFGSDYTGWYRHHEVEADYQKFKATGANFVRLALSQNFWETNPTCIDINNISKDYRTLIDNIVEWCRENRLYLMLEHHDDIDQTTKALIYDNPASWQQFLVDIAARYKDQDHVSISIMSEPPGYYYYTPDNKDETSLKWRTLASNAITAIRAINPNVLIWVDPAGFDLMYDYSSTSGSRRGPLPFTNIVYNIHHYYHSDIIYGSDPDYAPYYQNGDFTVAKTMHEQWLLNLGLKLLAQENIPIAVTEIGVWRDDLNWDRQIREFYDLAAKYEVSWMQWWWHGYWGPNSNVDYHLLALDWQTLSPSGEIYAEFLGGS